MCGSGSDLVHALQRVKDAERQQTAPQGKHSREGTDLLETADPLSLSFQSKGLKTDKLPAHVFEIDEDAKDEVSKEGPERRRITDIDHCAEDEWSAIDSLGPFMDRLHHAYTI